MNIFPCKVNEYGDARDWLSVSSLFMIWGVLKIELLMGFFVLTEKSYAIFLVTRALVFLMSALSLFCSRESDPRQFYVPS